jgi:hypothetical protein
MPSEGSLTVQPDGSLAVDKHPGEDTAALDATLSTFAEPASATETQSLYQLTAASIWRARRQGLSLVDILQTLEVHSQIEIPSSWILAWARGCCMRSLCGSVLIGPVCRSLPGRRWASPSCSRVGFWGKALCESGSG